MLTRECRQCGTAFHPDAGNVRRGGGIYCQLRCFHDARRQNLSVRFWAKVRKTAECWEWAGAKTPNGYGSIRRSSGESAYAHRVVLELAGEDLTGKVLAHSCDNPGCVNPDHLTVGTDTDNVADKVKKRRHRYGRRHPMSRLDEATVLVIRSRITAGESQSAIARAYGLDPSTVSNIKTRRLWSHV